MDNKQIQARDDLIRRFAELFPQVNALDLLRLVQSLDEYLKTINKGERGS